MIRLVGGAAAQAVQPRRRHAQLAVARKAAARLRALGMCLPHPAARLERRHEQPRAEGA